MAPAHSTHPHPRVQQQQQQQRDQSANADIPDHGLFLEPMMGTPLAMYVHKDVPDHDPVVDLITKNGGAVANSYSGVNYILVNPHAESGQNLYRQYVGKRGKVVLDARWVHECIKAGALQTFVNNFAGCKVTGKEHVRPPAPLAPTPAPASILPPGIMPQTLLPQSMQAVETTGASFAYPTYQTQLQPATPAPPQTWQASNGIAPEQTQSHLPQQMIQPRGPYRDDTWDPAYQPAGQPTGPMDHTPAPSFEYPDQAWNSDQYFATQGYDPSSYSQPYIPEGGPSTEPSPPPAETADPPRGRKRTRTQPTPAPPASALVNRRNPNARSPTPPSRVVKSTYGGNLFTHEDIEYLKKYIDYCVAQGLVLSLREICERVAVKVGCPSNNACLQAESAIQAPHHTFYSWRRYCNKHQIRLGGYAMTNNISDDGEAGDGAVPSQAASTGPGSNGIINIRERARAELSNRDRSRSPTPPRALFRSTTGKGVAFTDEDVAFLIKLLDYKKKSQGKLDMVAFWKEIAQKAPHHSRASWMKFYRRHKHELNHTENDDPLPQAPEKKMRYSRADDVLLAKFFFNKPDGTSDKIFQAFGRSHPHHPWKGWQEHHRIHKQKIDHLIQRLGEGHYIDELDPVTES
ncbi:hypothetical protein B0F90DRAFT_1808773 [Multifurca ochricompacta]|uniref:BRCT domain-containing protein n=1 Tax=Multifurca ochricompacta TaxID=376703 RepID=A0AAD4M809_9AGAM|nr:hypothetical protein B0F90DRAFT_1808773 [Multifurca ochricompacta]